MEALSEVVVSWPRQGVPSVLSLDRLGLPAPRPQRWICRILSAELERTPNPALATRLAALAAPKEASVEIGATKAVLAVALAQSCGLSTITTQERTRTPSRRPTPPGATSERSVSSPLHPAVPTPTTPSVRQGPRPSCHGGRPRP